MPQGSDPSPPASLTAIAIYVVWMLLNQSNSGLMPWFVPRCENTDGGTGVTGAGNPAGYPAASMTGLDDSQTKFTYMRVR